MPARLTIDPALTMRFPGLDAHLFEIDGLTVRSRGDSLAAFAGVLARELRERFALATLKDDPVIRAYRDFYWRVGIDPTKVRPASEALLRRVLQGKDLPRISNLVGAYNLASMKTRISIAAFDAERVRGDFRMRIARAGEEFQGIGMDASVVLDGVEVVVQDEDALVAVYPYRDTEGTKVTESSRSVLFMTCGVPGIPRDSLLEAADITREFVDRFCRGPS